MLRFRRELDVEDEIYDILKELRQQKFHNIAVDVKRQYEIKYDKERKADIAVLGINKPLLLIETKIKKRDKLIRLFRITSKEILGQVFSYAAILKKSEIYVPFVAVAHQRQIAIYKVPEDIEKWINWEAVDKREYDRVFTYSHVFKLNQNYRLKHVPIKFTKDFFVGLIDELAGIYAKTYKFEDRRQELRYGIIEDLRDFVDTISTFAYEAIAKETKAEKIESCEDLKKFYKDDFAETVIDYCKKTGYSPRPEVLAREMSYVLMNKIIFYKILERFYDLSKLIAFYEEGKVKSASEYLKTLGQYFGKAKKERDFEYIFETGLYDHIDIIEDEEVCNSLDWLINFIDWYKIEKFGDIIGYVYEDLIPPEERHQFGQYYTPKPVAELIVRWCIRDPDETILDPGCGSGTFLVEAYRRLAELKLKKSWKEIKGYVKRDVHKQILKQLWAFDINEFPAHLTAMNIAIKNPRELIEEINVITDDFFNTSPEQEKLIPYKSYRKTVKITIFDCVVGNPPYTRWTEIPEQTQKFIRDQVGKYMSKYNLTPQVSKGVEPGIYVFWIMHATKLLKDGGRLGMIISDSWLQADYGIGFANFLLDHYKVHAIIDISSRVFPVPLIGTCIVLLEKCSNKEERNKNKAVFMYLNIKEGKLDINVILKAIERAKEGKIPATWINQQEFKELLEKLKTPPIIKVYEQSELYDKKWINLIFNVDEILKLEENEKIVKLSEYFEVSRSNIFWSYWALQHGKRPDVGGEAFFYLTEDDLKNYKIPKDYTYSLLPSSDYLEFFSFNKDDWERIRKEGKECYIFLAHKPLNQLPEQVKRYIRLGETEVRLKRKRKGESEPRPVCESEASKARAKYRDYFYGWYDLGGVLEAPIYVTYGAQYWIRFNLAKFNVALDHRILSLLPKTDFAEDELKALLAFLNSSFSQLQAEIRGRSTGGGMIELDVKPLKEFLILDIKKLDEEEIKTLASLFDELEEKARELGNAKDGENVFGTELARELTGKDIREEKDGLFNTVIKEIDFKIAEILNIPNIVDLARNLVLQLEMRRLARVEAKPEALKGSEEFIVKLMKKKEKKTSNSFMTLDKFGLV